MVSMGTASEHEPRERKNNDGTSPPTIEHGLRGGQSQRQYTEGIASTSNSPTMMARKGQNQSSSANLTFSQRFEAGKRSPTGSPVRSGVGYAVMVESTLEAATFRIGDDQ
ncbi:hypothetical protein Poly51_59090 [Rubripirellula tenax]|uniref:Uncharacterized protein n=1 Tax=Rubripirellula tenax TaxID=2528015 RepID=A0A5C6E751_9BACT|nr:hypothetical protein Poly51_59090 [Rubripirellula tenax]